MSDLYLICGQPGCGKSTLAKQYVGINKQTIWVSRDTIRYSLLKDDDKYFDQEENAYREFVKQICDGLAKGYDVIADQTNLTAAARKKLLNAVDCANGLYDNAYAVLVETSLETSLARNEKRTGREYVPPKAIENMYKRMTCPSVDEGFEAVYIVNGE